MRRTVLIPALLLVGASLPAAVSPALSDLGQAINAYSARDYGTAVQRLRGKSIPELSDYVTWYLAASEQLTGAFDAALKVLDAYRKNPAASSPLAGKIAVLHARVLLDVNNQKHDPSLPAAARRILREDYKLLPQPEGDFALALAEQAANNPHEAALGYQRVYYGSPNADLAADAGVALARLRESMGSDYPAPSARQQLDRCAKWIALRQYRKARAEYAALAESLAGADRDAARVGIGTADTLAGSTAAALHYLTEFHADAPEVEAERLYRVVDAARRVVDDNAMLAAVAELGRQFPESPWRMKALVAAGNRYASVNDRARYSSFYQAASESFPGDPVTASAHWRLAWDAYTGPQPERTGLLREQVERYPFDSHASTALYFLGRVAEAEGAPAEARAYYAYLSARFPHYFYTTLAKDRKLPETVVPDPATEKWLSGIAWPDRRDFSQTEPNDATRRRMARARLLVEAGQPDSAEAEARFGARSGNEQAQLLAVDLARIEPSPFKALRLMKSLASDYLALPTSAASARFWQALFPMPWKEDIFRDAVAHDLDPYHVAGLIRQESEFNPGAKSRANAYGLMQLLPSTGRMLGRQQGVAVPKPVSLFNPSLNIQLGSRYLRAQLDTWGGDWYRTLAAYNAGPSRVREWTSNASLHEPVEFIETIPFDETREYVQAVLRNADLYREIYDGKPVETVSPKPAAAKTPPAGAAATKPPAAKPATRKPQAKKPPAA